MVATLVQPQSELAMDKEHKRYATDAEKRAQRLSAHPKDNSLALPEHSSDKSSQEDLFLHMAQGREGDDDTIQGNRRVSKDVLSPIEFESNIYAAVFD